MKQGLESLFNTLNLPKVDNEGTIEAKAIQGYKQHRIAVDSKGFPLFLINVHMSRDVIDESLYNIQIQHNKSCEIETENGNRKYSFSIIKYTGEDAELRSYFFKICEIILPLLGDNPSTTTLINAINKFKELFKSLTEPPKTTLQGLWAELFIISRSKRPKEYINAWHVFPDETIDFTFQNVRIDVKSSTKSNRTHRFNVKQLIPAPNFKSFIISIITEVNSQGISISDLLQDIECKVDSIDLITKVKSVTYKTLGESSKKISDYFLDDVIASQTLRVYNITDIPIVEKIHDNIFDVSFRTDLNLVNHLDETVDSILNF